MNESNNNKVKLTEVEKKNLINVKTKAAVKTTQNKKKKKTKRRKKEREKTIDAIEDNVYQVNKCIE